MKRLLFWASLGSIAGTLAVLSEIWALAVSVIALSLLAVIVLSIGRTVPKIAIALPVAALLGVLLCFLYLRKERSCTEALFAMQEIRCVVTEVKETSFTAAPEADDCSTFRILVYSGDELPAIGDRISVEGPLQDLPAASNEGEWDAATYYRSHRYLGTASAWKPVGRGELTLRMRLYRLREGFSARIDMLYPKETAAMVKAVLYCERSELDQEVSERYRQLGIAHILAVSGLHVSVFGGILTAMFLLVMRRPRAEAASAVVLFCYGAITGFPVSCARAVFMALLSGIGRLCGRTPDRLTNITFTAAVFLMCRPVLILQQGFVLSFACAYILLRISTEHEAEKAGESAKTGAEGSAESKRRTLFGKALDSCGKAIRMGIRLSLFLLPFQVAFFYTTSPFTPLLNAMVLPLMGLLLPAAALSVGLSFVWVLSGRLAAGLPHYGFTLIDGASQFLRKMPASVVVAGKPCLWNYMAFGILFACIALLRRKHMRIATMISALVFLCFLPIRSGEMRICNLSVGQGDCCVILRGNACVVIDCGASGRTAVGERILQPFLMYHGFEKPSLVIISHTDSDHVNGLTELLQGEWSEVTVALPIIERNGEYAGILQSGEAGRVRFLSDGDRIRVSCGLFADDLTITALHPEADSRMINMDGTVIDTEGTAAIDTEESAATGIDKNENCLVVSVSDGRYSALFTGDCGNEALAEIVLRNAAEVAESDYLKVAHHGSVHSAESSFYEVIHPAVAVISVGANNYGHPSPVTIEMAERAGAAVYVTRSAGQVTTRFGRKGIYVATFSCGQDLDEQDD